MSSLSLKQAEEFAKTSPGEAEQIYKQILAQNAGMFISKLTVHRR